MASAWDAYIKNIRDQAHGNCDQATILGLKDGGCWNSETCPGGLRISPQEAATLARAFSRKKYDEFRTKGIHVGGKKYFFVSSDDNDRIVIGRCKDETITMQKSITALVIAHTPGGKQPGNTNVAVNSIASYLRSVKM